MARKRRVFDVNNLIQCYLAGETENRLSQRFGVSRPTVIRRLQDAGIARRSMGEANKLAAAQLTPEARRARARAANEARRGQRAGEREMFLKAQRRNRRVGAGEEMLRGWLEQRGYFVDAQRPEGRYNLDLAILPIAVEVHVNAHHPSSDTRILERVEYLRDRGWHMVYVWITRRYFLSESAADKIIALLDTIRRSPSISCQYWVIRGNGEDAPPHRPQPSHRAVVVAAEA
jgi:hypothetical protein